MLDYTLTMLPKRNWSWDYILCLKSPPLHDLHSTNILYSHTYTACYTIAEPMYTKNTTSIFYFAKYPSDKSTETRLMSTAKNS